MSFDQLNIEKRNFIAELDQKHRENFGLLYYAAKNFRQRCCLENPVSEEDARMYTTLMIYECPELFNVVTDGYIFETTPDNRVRNIYITYSMGKSEYMDKLRRCRDVIDGFCDMHTLNSPYEKELAAYDFFADRCVYDIEAPDCDNAYGALVKGRAKCIGISLAMKWMLESVGVRCLVSSGLLTEDAQGHAWNVVKINNEYLDVDITPDVGRKAYKLYAAFNVDRHWIRDMWTKEREQSVHDEVPGYDSMDLSYHARNNSLIRKPEEINEKLCHALDRAGDEGFAPIQFGTQELYREGLGCMKDIYGRWKKERAADDHIDISFAKADIYRTLGIVIKKL